MKKSRFTGKTESDAVMNAAMSLGIPSTDIHYKVLDAGSSGFFGFFKKPVIIELITKEQEEQEKKKQANQKKDSKNLESHEIKSSSDGEMDSSSKNKVKNPDELVKKTSDFLDDVLTSMGLEPKINIFFSEKNNTINVNISGEKMGILIGKHGQTLDSLQYLTNLYLNRESEIYIKVKIDTENYRERRQATLEKLAISIASKVKRTKKSVHLEPMNPNERRIIHSTLQKDKDVITKSEGVDPHRKVIVMYKKK